MNEQQQKGVSSAAGASSGVRRPNSAAEWRQRSLDSTAEEVTLPSGITIRARRLTALRLAQDDRLPLGLASLLSPGVAGKTSDADLHGQMIFLRDLIIENVVEPRVSLDAKPGDPAALHPSEIGDKDLAFLFAWFLRADEVATLRRFRERRESPAVGDDVRDVPPVSVDGDGDHRPDRSAEPEPGCVGAVAASASGSDSGDPS